MLANALVCSTVPTTCGRELVEGNPWSPRPDERKHS